MQRLFGLGCSAIGVRPIWAGVSRIVCVGECAKRRSDGGVWRFDFWGWRRLDWRVDLCVISVLGDRGGRSE